MPKDSQAAAHVLSGHIALISGAGGDLGRAVAVEYARAGATLILLDSNQKELEKTDDAVKLAGGTAALVVLNLTELEKVAGLGPALYERYGKLDSVTACHGARSTPTPLGHISKKEWERNIANNITATWQLIQLTQPLLSASERGLFLGVTCASATEFPGFNASYNVGRAGAEALVQTFQAETSGSSTSVHLVDPGEMLTRSRRTAYPYQKAGDAPKAEDVAPQFVDLLTTDTELLGRIVLDAHTEAAE